MCLNVVFIPIVYFFLPETNGWKLETLDEIFADAHEKKQNPVFTERHWRKNGYKGKKDSQAGQNPDRNDSDADTKVIEAGDDAEARHLEEKQV